MASKICTKCKENRLLIEYHKASKEKDGLKDACKYCIKEQSRERYINNKERINKVTRSWKQRNKSRTREIQKERLKTDINYKLSRNLRKRLWEAVKNKKPGSAIKELGCTVEELKIYLEKKFYPHPVSGEIMTWENYGLYGWHIDHKKPLAAFNLSNKKQFKQACHFTNLQPMWAEENLTKWCKETI